MPNWIKNKLIVGSSEYIETIIKKYCVYNTENKQYDLDFNKVIKMNENLNIEFSSMSEKGLTLYLTKINPSVKYYGNLNDKILKETYLKIENMLKDHFIIKNKEIIYSEDELNKVLLKYSTQEQKLLDLGKKQIDNLIKYNAINWYEWSINNWGCKWNASDLKILDNKKSITFETPWDPPIPVILEMSKQNPTIKFAFLYSDEEIGCNVGYMLCQKGKIDYKGSFKNKSKDAYLLAFELWNCKDDYTFDETKNTYVYSK